MVPDNVNEGEDPLEVSVTPLTKRMQIPEQDDGRFAKVLVAVTAIAAICGVHPTPPIIIPPEIFKLVRVPTLVKDEFTIPEGRVLPVNAVSERPVAFAKFMADGVPRSGVVKVGDVARTIPPLPVTADSRADVTPVPKPVIPVDTGRPVPCVRTTEEGVPKAGVTKIGELRVGVVASTILPDPETVVPRAVATPMPNPAKPVDTGNPVVLVRVPDSGVPKTGAVSVGEEMVGDVARTIPPLPVTADPRADVTPVPVPTKPVAIGSPVALVRLSAVGVPSEGATSVGEVRVLLVRVWVDVKVTKVSVIAGSVRV